MPTPHGKDGGAHSTLLGPGLQLLSSTTRLRSDVFSDSEYATGVVEGRTRAQRATGLVRRAGTCFSKHASCIEFSSTTSEPTPGSLPTKSPTPMANTQQVASDDPLVERYSSMLCCCGRRSTVSPIWWFASFRELNAARPARNFPGDRHGKRPHFLSFKRTSRVRRGHPRPARATLARQIREEESSLC